MEDFTTNKDDFATISSFFTFELQEELLETFPETLTKSSLPFTPIPVEQTVSILGSIILLSVVLNSFVIAFYKKAKTSNRSYVLALALLDFLSVIFCLFPQILEAIVPNDSAKYFFDRLASFFVVNLFNFYMFPSLFLAVDRFFAVFYPHKFKIFAPKIRKGKIVILVLSSSFQLLRIIVYFLTGEKSVLSVALEFIAFTWIFVQVVTSTILYVAIAVKILRSNKKMAENRNITLKETK